MFTCPGCVMHKLEKVAWNLPSSANISARRRAFQINELLKRAVSHEKCNGNVLRTSEFLFLLFSFSRPHCICYMCYAH